MTVNKILPRGKWIRRHLLAGACGLIVINPSETGAVEDISFNRDIRPILSANCFSCHGPDKKARKAKLRLDTREGALVDLGGYRALEPGKADDSELILRIESDDPEEIMPPPDSGHELTQKDRKALREWVNAGGEYETHWSFNRPVKTPLPKTKKKDWPLHPLDHFILSKLESNGMEPSRDLDRHLWIRRASLDLTGLPPTLEDADSFAQDKNKDAYEKVVDRLLASSAYGEHWARMWLDLARYADTKGYEKDRHRNIWFFRNWVIDAFNQDMPFDQFTTEQLAGDLLPDPTPEQLVATAFHRNTMTNDEGGTDNEEFRVAAVKDRVDLTVQVWMGLTMGCAKCHSHKYDPITNDEYYSFYAFFNQTEDNDHSKDLPVYRVTPKASRQKLAALTKELADKTVDLENAKKDGLPEILKWLKTKKALAEKWVTFTPTSAVSKNGSTLTIREDQSILASGKSPATDEYTLTGTLPAGVYHTLRLDALTHPSLGNRNGPGRNQKDPNFVLNEMTFELLPSKGGSPQTLTFKQATADFEQKGWPVKGAIDGNPKTGWAISPKFGSDHLARFSLAQPLTIRKGNKVRIKLTQQYGSQLCFGRIRVSAGKPDTEKLSLPDLQTAMLSSLAEESLTPSRRQLIGQLRTSENKSLHPLQKQIASLKGKISRIEKTAASVPVMREIPVAKKRITRVHKRGNFLNLGDVMTPELPKLFDPPDNLPQNRLGVAKWLMTKENPLTARVMVNRIWARLFGIGIVETEEDFGSQGLMPSHPELLDWLAVDYRENGWSLKKLLRTIALSRTYRQSSSISAKSLASDPVNRLLGRGPRFRLSAEVVRDQSLVASGLLTRKIGGPSVMPPQPPGVWKSTYSGEKWKTATGPDRYRRGLYTYLKRTSPHPAMITFDAGSGEVCQIRRIRTNTPLQALIILNDEAYVEAAGALANLMQKSSGQLNEQITFGFRKILTRSPKPEEVKRLIELYHQLKPEFSDHADFLSSAKLAKGDPSLIALASVLLNLDETLMKP